MKDFLKKLISEHGLAHKLDQLLAASTTGLRIVKQPSRNDVVGISRLGGLPDVSSGFEWPNRDGRSLGFLAQINCAETAAYDSENVLPSTGWLYFFYDVQEQPWGFDPMDRGSGVVLYSHAAPIETAQPADYSTKEAATPSIPIGFRSILSLPVWDSAARESIGLGRSVADNNAYYDLYDAFTKEASDEQTNHQLLGHSNNIQGDMQLECQLVSHGLYCGDSTGYEDRRVKELEAGAGDWRLLLQFDSDDELNVMWGDCGKLYFWIRGSDLAQHNFSRTWTILQCG